MCFHYFLATLKRLLKTMLWEVLSLGTFCPWDVLSWDVLSWDVLYVHRIFLLCKYKLKGIVSRNVEGLQMILMNRAWVPDVPLKVNSFLKLHFHIVF